jgi:hypothetical protein
MTCFFKYIKEKASFMNNKINRRVYFEFNGFDGLDDGKTIIGGKSVKLFSRNFDKILNLLLSKMLIKGVNHKDGYVDISSLALKATLDNYKPYIQYLIEKNYLERDYFVYKTNGRVNPEYFYKNYRKSKPFGFRLTETFKQSITIKRVIFVPNNNESKIIYKPTDKSLKNKSTNSLDINPETIKRLKKDFKSCQILNTEIQKTNYPRSKFIDIAKYFYNQALLFKWKSGDETFKFSTGRLYTNFTRISSHVRLSNIQLNNEYLKCKDISNSFPLMLSIYCVKQNPDLVHDADFIEYCSWVKSGTFYQELTNGINQIRNVDEKSRLNSINLNSKKSELVDFDSENLKSKRIFSKDLLKILFQIYLNGKIESVPHYMGYGNSLINEFMKTKFPCIHEHIIKIKEGQECVYDVLVKIESDFIFNVVGQLYKQYDKIKLLTVHDSIYTNESDFNKLEVEWDKQFQELIAELPAETISQRNDEIDCNIEIEELDDEEFINETDYSYQRRMFTDFIEEDEDDFFD